MSRFNRFGVVYTDVIAMYPGTVVQDYDAQGASGQVRIEAAIDRATREISAAFTPEVYSQIHNVNAEAIATFATASQSSFTLGLTPVVAGSLHLWIYPNLALLDAPGGWGNYQNSYLGSTDDYFRNPRKGINEVASSSFALTAATGAVSLTGVTVNAGDRVYASYDVDTDNAAFSMPSVADIVVIGAAAELGSRLFSAANQEWKLVETYREKFASRNTVSEGGFKSLALSGEWVPDELRKLSFFKEVERASNQASSIRLRRG